MYGYDYRSENFMQNLHVSRDFEAFRFSQHVLSPLRFSRFFFSHWYNIKIMKNHELHITEE